MRTLNQSGKSSKRPEKVRLLPSASLLNYSMCPRQACGVGRVAKPRSMRNALWIFASAYGLLVSGLFEGKLLTAPTQTAFDRLGIVVEHIERMIQSIGKRPKPEAVRTAVVEVLRLETSRVLDITGSAFDPSRYDAMVNGILGQSS